MKTYKPTTPSLRNTVITPYKELLSGDAKAIPKNLVKGKNKSGGRNNQGRITMRHIGGGNKNLLRDVDFKYKKRDVPGRIEAVQYDPVRSAFIALVVYKDGERAYVVAPKGMKKGDTMVTGENVAPTVGNRLPLKRIAVGTEVYNVEVQPEGGAKLARSAGNFITIIANDAGYASCPPTSLPRATQPAGRATVRKEPRWPPCPSPSVGPSSPWRRGGRARSPRHNS